MKYFKAAICALVLITACKTGENNDCPSGKPLPIFSSELPVVKSHDYSASGQTSREEVKLANGVQLEILQQGCDTLSQSFRFSFDDKIKRDSFVTSIDSAISQFRYLSSSGEKLKPFVIWSDALTQIREHVQQGEYLELDRGIKLRIDQLDQGNGSTIIIDVMQISAGQ